MQCFQKPKTKEPSNKKYKISFYHEKLIYVIISDLNMVFMVFSE